MFFSISNTKRSKFNYKKRVKRLLLLKAKANTTRLCLELEELKEKRYSCKRKKIAATKEFVKNRLDRTWLQVNWLIELIN